MAPATRHDTWHKPVAGQRTALSMASLVNVTAAFMAAKTVHFRFLRSRCVGHGTS